MSLAKPTKNIIMYSGCGVMVPLASPQSIKLNSNAVFSLHYRIKYRAKSPFIKSCSNTQCPNVDIDRNKIYTALSIQSYSDVIHVPFSELHVFRPLHACVYMCHGMPHTCWVGSTMLFVSGRRIM